MTRRLLAAAVVVLTASLWALGAAGLGLAVNSLRSTGRLPLVAPFPYEHDCPEKLDLTTPTVDAVSAWRLSQSHRVHGPQGARGVVLVDARPGEDFAITHIRGARSYPYSFVTPFSKGDAAKLKAFVHVFVYGDSPGDRLAGVQAEIMKRAGLARIKVVSGGLSALEKAAGPEGLVGTATTPAPATTTAPVTEPATTTAPSASTPATATPKGVSR